MSNQEKTEHVYRIIQDLVKECAFTFDDLKIELYDKHHGDKVIISFTFNEWGNNNKSLIDVNNIKNTGCSQ